MNTNQHPKDKEGLFICQCCHEHRYSLASHIKKHGMYAWEYLIKYNLPGYTDLSADKTLAKLSNNAKHGKFNTKSIKMS